MTIFKDSHRFSRTLGDVWWQSLKTAITSAELWAAFDDNLERQPSLQQNFGRCLMTIFYDIHHFNRTLGDVWWQSLKTAITSAELWAAFDDNLERQPSLQQNFGRCLMTIFKDSHRFSRTLGDVWWQSLTTAITSAELWAAFDDHLERQPSLQQNFGRCLMTILHESLYFGRCLMTILKESLYFGRCLMTILNDGL